jgi:hypothetical protein
MEGMVLRHIRAKKSHTQELVDEWEADMQAGWQNVYDMLEAIGSIKKSSRMQEQCEDAWSNIKLMQNHYCEKIEEAQRLGDDIENLNLKVKMVLVHAKKFAREWSGNMPTFVEQELRDQIERHTLGTSWNKLRESEDDQGEEDEVAEDPEADSDIEIEDEDMPRPKQAQSARRLAPTFSKAASVASASSMLKIAHGHVVTYDSEITHVCEQDFGSRMLMMLFGIGVGIMITCIVMSVCWCVFFKREPTSKKSKKIDTDVQTFEVKLQVDHGSVYITKTEFSKCYHITKQCEGLRNARQVHVMRKCRVCGKKDM